MSLTMHESAFRAAITDLALAASDHGPILDLGCGTGSQLLRLAQRASGRELVGIDVDSGILERARVKLAAAGATAILQRASADDLPLADGSVAVAITCLVLHHLAPLGKRLALAELIRVLEPGGRLIVVDWGRPTDPLTRIGFRLLRMLDGFENTAEHAAGQLPTLIADAGFHEVVRPKSWSTVWGMLELWIADAPDQPPGQ